MSETPDWLADNNAGDSGGAGNFEMTTGVAQTTPAASATSGGGASSSDAAAAEDEEGLPKMILLMRLANMGVAIALVTCSVSDYEWNSMPMDILYSYSVFLFSFRL